MKKKEIQNDGEYSRSQDLGQKFNECWKKIFKSDKDYFSLLSLSDFIKLKIAISDINNIITLRVTILFVDYLFDKGFISWSQANKIKKAIDGLHPNTNGYDIKYSSEDKKIIAEVKCCIPAGKNCYGAAQEDSIISDIKHLSTNKLKSGMSDAEIKDYYKFMVLLDGEKVPESIDKLLKKTKNIPDVKAEMLTNPANLTKDTVYIVPNSI